MFGLLDCCGRTGYQQIGATGPRFGVRHVQCILMFFGLAVAYSMRVNLSVAIVAMTDRNASNPDSGFPEFDWDASEKSYLLSSFFWGYVVTQVPGGYLSSIYGAKHLVFFSVIICSFLALLTPFCAITGGWKLVTILRAAQGLSQGVIFPSTHTFLSKWSPAEERGRLVGYCYSGAQFGTVIMLSAAGYMASSPFGWPSTFYVPGCVGIIWAFVWFFLSASTPADHPSITPSERRYIEASGQVRRSSDVGRDINEPGGPTPWARIFTSVPFLVLVFAHCSNNWGFWGLLTEIPTFMKSVLGMDMRSNGPLSALPYLVMCGLTFVFIWLSDVLKGRGNVIRLAYSRKIFNSIGMWLPMIALIGLGYISAGEDNEKIAVALLTLAVGTNAATYLGFQVNHIDLSPNFAGTMMGITNCAANFMSILAPLVVGLIVRDETDPTQWRIVFFLFAFIYFIGNLLFVVFGRTSVQPWNYWPQQQPQQQRSPIIPSPSAPTAPSESNDENHDEHSPLIAES